MEWRCILVIFCTLSIFSSVISVSPHDADIDDNEFAEFEDFEEDVIEEEVDNIDVKSSIDEKKEEQEFTAFNDEDEESNVETEDEEEFEHFEDEEEFTGYSKDSRGSGSKTKEKVPDLKIAKVPVHLRTNWDSFYMEILMLAGLGVYFLNFLHGKNKNHKLAQAWINSHKEMLETNFSIVGDDGTTKEAQSGSLMKESEHVYLLWCSGRVYVEGMLIELRFLKRQDLISTMSNILKPSSDQIMVTIDLDQNVMDKFVFAIAQKKVCGKMHKEMQDLYQFTEKKNLPADRFPDMPNSFQILSEIGEVTNAMLDKRVCQALIKYESQIEFIHFSDQFSGIKPQDDSQTTTKRAEIKPVLSFCFNVAGKGKSTTADMEAMKPLLQLVFHCLDKVSRFQLSKEGRAKAEKNRKKAEELFLKAAHSQLQEAAQQRREEKRRQEKERMMNEDDPEKTRKWEERENKRELKRKQPKMKMMKV